MTVKCWFSTLCTLCSFPILRSTNKNVCNREEIIYLELYNFCVLFMTHFWNRGQSNSRHTTLILWCLLIWGQMEWDYFCFLAAQQQHLTYFISASNSFPLLLNFISIQLLRITTFAHFIKNFTHQNSKYLRILSHRCGIKFDPSRNIPWDQDRCFVRQRTLWKSKLKLYLVILV